MKAVYHIPPARRHDRPTLEDLRLKRDASENAELAGYTDQGETDALREAITLELRRRGEREDER